VILFVPTKKKSETFWENKLATSRLDKLRARRMDPLFKVAGSREVYERLASEDSSTRYVIGSLQPIDFAYTQKTIEERTRVEKQLADGFARAGLGINFDYQGSVTNDTHIRVYSDVDLLTICPLSYAIEPPNKPTVAYNGDPISDLREIRRRTIEILRAAFPAATVDRSKGKCLNISGGSLARKIDLIASEWWHTVEFMQQPQKHWLGIQVLDNDEGKRVPNKPFLHNKRIEERDLETGGGLRKVIRLFKPLKYDNESKIEVSSYDIAGIAYNIFPQWLAVGPGQDLLLVSNARNYLSHLLQDKNYRDTLAVPNDMRKVFGPGGATETGLKQLFSALDTLLSEIERELTRTSRKLKEARINY
jgi:hypothetical protein